MVLNILWFKMVSKSKNSLAECVDSTKDFDSMLIENLILTIRNKMHLRKCTKGPGHPGTSWTMRDNLRRMATFLLFKFYWKFTNVLQTSVKHHIHFTGHRSQAKCWEQSLAERTPKGPRLAFLTSLDTRHRTWTLAYLTFPRPVEISFIALALEQERGKALLCGTEWGNTVLGCQRKWRTQKDLEGEIKVHVRILLCNHGNQSDRLENAPNQWLSQIPRQTLSATYWTSMAKCPVGSRASSANSQDAASYPVDASCLTSQKCFPNMTWLSPPHFYSLEKSEFGQQEVSL